MAAEVSIDAISLSLFASRVSAICEEMGAVLARSALSPNIRDRLDYSCALFDGNGDLVAQATHIPVHLGSMAYAMRGLAGKITWRQGDVMILNDPFAGGTHLPDVTLIAALVQDNQLLGFAVSRAHYADIGSAAPGSMPVSNSLEQEGVLIEPQLLYQAGEYQPQVLAPLLQAVGDQSRVGADLEAQLSACRTGCRSLLVLISSAGQAVFEQRLAALNDYAERLARVLIRSIPDGEYRFNDVLDGDGFEQQDVRIQVKVSVRDDSLTADFAGTDRQVPGNINCPLSVTAAAVYYVIRCLLPDYTPNCAGVLRALRLTAPPGSLVHAQGPAAVAAGNVETSMRIVDVLCGALQPALPEVIPAASQGTMNNLAMGGEWRQAGQLARWSYYETLAGGCGASSEHAGRSAVHSHMTNTLNTPVEVLESEYPLRIRRYAIRYGSGGQGKHPGGDGIVREYDFLHPTTVSIISERRRHPAWGIGSGTAGQPGSNRLNNECLPAKLSCQVNAGDTLSIATPGGGAWSDN